MRPFNQRVSQQYFCHNCLAANYIQYIFDIILRHDRESSGLGLFAAAPLHHLSVGLFHHRKLLLRSDNSPFVYITFFLFGD